MIDHVHPTRSHSVQYAVNPRLPPEVVQTNHLPNCDGPAASPMATSSGGRSISGPRIWTSLAVSLLSVHAPPPPPAPGMADDLPASVHDISVKDIKGNDVKLSEYAGKVLLIVNVASKCGLTNSNYKELNVLYEKYKGKGLEILAFPCNQFAGQEPGSNEEIEQTVCTRFKAEFPVFDKIDVNGKEVAPLYKFLKSQKGGFLGDGIKWNFTKFLVDKDGKVVERYAPTTSPLKIENDIQKLLGTS
ncbi:hypothetical protein E2562_035176 [Oryza meyeriana var. granulata]|uniref:Glutathione peroxidase n=1 Tax=Oryza meyeriana var. granulata TaxID=110450 RepID=A0A6G1CBA2_9ORYZ|nr:hypothetical protein E2562_035176 [Oryza meyeriana var. granulata]